ncbi:MAG: hypothetical protein JWO80_6489 [Bryobacterales bacterium]|jgi:hypothetical protein|nr:hypothetical protein [Bryobacterales bacterium]
MWQVTRRWWVLASFSAQFAFALNAQNLVVRLNHGNFVHISAPSLHFLTGKPLERLKDGATVSFFGQLSISNDANATVQARAIARFALSYDIWEEKFKATRFSISKTETPARSASNLSAAAAEAWCLDNLTIDASQFPPSKPIWIRLELRAEDGQDSPGVVGDPGINLTRLIELFSRPPHIKEPGWRLDVGPLRLADLRKAG